jgi:hypothetical protein
VNFHKLLQRWRQALPLAFIGLLAAACSSSRQQVDDQAHLPRLKFYAHCEACNWCKGSFRKAQDAQRIVSEHNIKLHDWIKVAYYDHNECSR